MLIMGFLTETFATGGIQHINRHVCLALSRFAAREGHCVRFLSLMDDPDQVDERYLAGNVSFQGFHGNRMAFVRAALSELKKRPDVVYAAHINLASLALAMRWLKPALRYGVALYGIEAWQPLSLLKRYALQQADFLTSISNYTSETAASTHNVMPEKFHLLPPVLDPFWLSSATETLTDGADLGVPNGRILLSVTRLAASEGYKGVDCVIQALPDVLERVPDVHYIVVGTGDDLPRLRALAEQESVERHVSFVGYVPEDALRAYYDKCDLFVLPSKGEGFGIVFLEAMFYEKPVIAGDHAGSRDVVEDGHTGLLIRHGDIDGLSRAIVDLLNDEERRSRLGQAGYERLMARYTFSHFSERLADLMQGVG